MGLIFEVARARVPFNLRPRCSADCLGRIFIAKLLTLLLLLCEVFNDSDLFISVARVFYSLLYPAVTAVPRAVITCFTRIIKFTLFCILV